MVFLLQVIYRWKELVGNIQFDQKQQRKISPSESELKRLFFNKSEDRESSK